jgi:hypothetical protein
MTAEVLTQGVTPTGNGQRGEHQPQECLGGTHAAECRVDRLLACPEPHPYDLLLRGCRRWAGFEKVKWSDDLVDPEFRKNLRIFQRLIAGAVGLCERRRCPPADESAPRAVVPLWRADELQRRITLPEEVPITLQILLDRRFRLEMLLVELGDAEYLRSRAAELYEERESTYATWKTLFGSDPPPELDPEKQLHPDEQNKAGSPDSLEKLRAIEKTRLMLLRLLAAKEAQDLPNRARRDLKRRTLHQVLPWIVGAVLAFGVTVWFSQGSSIFLPLTAAVTGAALGMLLRLRDELNLGAQIRQFGVLFPVQIVVGATAGLLTAVASRTPILGAPDIYAVGAFSFVLGFSEAAFLGLVSKLGDSSGG